MSELKIAAFNTEWMIAIFGGEWKKWDGTIPNSFKGKTLGTIKLPKIELTDLNVDGFDELIIETKKYNAYISLQNGGMMYELDYKPIAKNIFDTMTRREEGYHKKLEVAVTPGAESQKTASIHDLILAKEPDLISKLHYDFYERKSFIDHFLDDNTTLRSFATVQYKENGDFLNQPYKLRSHSLSPAGAAVNLYREGKVSYKGKEELVRINKKIEFSNNNGEIIAYYTLVNQGKNPLNLWFGVEFNFGLQAGHAQDRYFYLQTGEIDDRFLDSVGEIPLTQFIGLRDEWRKLDINLEVNRKCTMWRFPIETISLSEAGFERVYQSSAVLPNWHIQLKDQWKVAITLRLNTIKT